MKNLIERYIYDVVRRLPDKMKEEVKNELQANIDDMLGENPTNEDIERVLYEMGETRILANQYRGKERYLISPVYFDQYIMVLKIVFLVFGIISFVTGTIAAIVEAPSQLWYEFIGSYIGNVVGSVFQGLTSAFAIITIIFVIIDYKNVKFEDNPKKWTLKDLPELPIKEDIKISRTKMLIGLIFGTVFMAAFIVGIALYMDYIGWYINGEMVVAFFNQAYVQNYIPVFILSFVAYTVITGLIIYRGYWNKRNTIAYIAYQLLSAIITVVFVSNIAMIRPEFITYIATFFSTTEMQVRATIVTISRVIAVLAVLGAITDSIRAWNRVQRCQSNQKKA